jgi:hypothetical protein
MFDIATKNYYICGAKNCAVAEYNLPISKFYMSTEEQLPIEENKAAVNYSEDNIVTLEWQEHIRRRPGMYIGKLGDGTTSDDGIYVLLKEVLDNAIDEYMMGFGKQIIVDIVDGKVVVRDYGRGIPLEKVVDVASKMNTGAKYDSAAFKKSVGLNGVGIKAVNALSTSFIVESVRDGRLGSNLFWKVAVAALALLLLWRTGGWRVLLNLIFKVMELCRKVFRLKE